MNSIDLNQEEEIICLCTGTTNTKIKNLIDNGKDDLDKISSATGASTGCGACDATILELINQYKACS